MLGLASAPVTVPSSIKEGLVAAAGGWASDPIRPRVADSVLRYWGTQHDPGVDSTPVARWYQRGPARFFLSGFR